MVKTDYTTLERIRLRLESGSVRVRTPIEDALLNNEYARKYENTWAIIVEFLKLIPKVIVSNTSFFCYVFMILAHIQIGSLMTLVYPISIFVYAIMEETRPKSIYWKVLIVYTSIILFTQY